MKQCFMVILATIVLTSIWLSGCGVSDNYMPNDEVQQKQQELEAQVKALQEELRQLKEQKKNETLQQAETYYEIIKFAGSRSPTTIKAVSSITVEEIGKSLAANSKMWSLVEATEDSVLMSRCQPEGEWNWIPCSGVYLKDYAEVKYRELMSEYYSQQYIDDQLYILEQAREESIAQAAQAAKEEAERKAAIDNLPVTYARKGSGRTPTFWTLSGSSNQYKLTLTTGWDGNISINWYQEDTSGTGSSLITLKANQVWRSTGISFGFPDAVEAGKTYEYIFNWNQSQKAVFFDITNVPTDGEWTITVSQMEPTTLRPLIDITLVVEYDGEFAYQSTTSSTWGISWRGVFSDNYSKVMENIQIPIHFRARKEDGGDNPLVLKIIYEGQVVTEDTAIGEDDEAWVYWEGPR